MMRIAALLLCLLASKPPSELQALGRLEHPAIREASGIVKSRRYPDIFWVHNDSGNAPALFAVKRDGTLVREFRVAMPNIDWEDIAIDAEGHLYLGEIGNNGTKLPMRAIYRLDEPDPNQPATAPLKITASTYYKFEEGRRFDAEGLFIDHGRAFVVAKYRDGRTAEIFSLPLDPPAPLLKPAVPQRVGNLPDFREPATGADLSRDGKFLAVCSYDVTRVYERSDQDLWNLVSTVRYPAHGVEAICWEGSDLILASEDRRVSRIPEATWRQRGNPEPKKDQSSKPPRAKQDS